jgi:hypothetical protein
MMPQPTRPPSMAINTAMSTQLTTPNKTNQPSKPPNVTLVPLYAAWLYDTSLRIFWSMEERQRQLVKELNIFHRDIDLWISTHSCVTLTLTQGIYVGKDIPLRNVKPPVKIRAEIIKHPVWDEKNSECGTWTLMLHGNVNTNFDEWNGKWPQNTSRAEWAAGTQVTFKSAGFSTESLELNDMYRVASRPWHLWIAPAPNAYWRHLINTWTLDERCVIRLEFTLENLLAAS